MRYVRCCLSSLMLFFWCCLYIAVMERDYADNSAGLEDLADEFALLHSQMTLFIRDIVTLAQFHRTCFAWFTECIELLCGPLFSITVFYFTVRDWLLRDLLLYALQHSQPPPVGSVALITYIRCIYIAFCLILSTIAGRVTHHIFYCIISKYHCEYAKLCHRCCILGGIFGCEIYLLYFTRRRMEGKYFIISFES